MAEEVYEVEKILSHKIIKKGKKFELTYLIKWLGYTEADNTWEKEANVFAVDMIAKYWSSIPKSNVERQLFERIQANKKSPIILHDSPKTINDADSAHASSLIDSKKHQQSLTDFLSTATEEGKGKGKETDSNGQESMDYEMADASPENQARRLPVVVANDSADELDEDEEEDEILGEAKKKSSAHTKSGSDSDFNLPSAGPSDKEDVQYSSASSDIQTIKKRKKRTKASYSDYFLEEHDRKRRNEEGYESTDSETNTTSSLKDADDGSVIFDESYGIDPIMDWDELAEKVIYIGQELPESPLYCVMKWKDGVKSVHPLSLVRTKRPDLVIDCFVTMVGR